MRVKTMLSAFAAISLVFAVLALPALAAVKLPVNTAAEKSFEFAKHTCGHDQNCVRYGVRNCRRQSLHVVLCRIFDERSTGSQGRYECTRLVRVVVDPFTYRIVVTGQSTWQC